MTVPNSARYLLPRHQILLALEADYFRHSRARRVIAVSRGLADDLADIYGVPDDIVTVIPNGYDAAQCNPQRRAAQRDELRSLAGIPPDAIVVLIVANELHRKGFGVLLDAVAQTRDERLRIHLVGRTPLDLYASRIETLGLAGRVTYGGLVDDVAEAHALADLFVLPTQYETFAIAALEALASGLPVVITRGTPGAGERVAHDDNGLLLDDPSDAEELSALLLLALDVDRRARWSRRAPASVADLTWERLMEQVEAVIREAA
jgi:glycosyltransferase involved in cell wall biosynthesis